MRVLFVGLGSIGQRHLRNLQQFGAFECAALRSRGRELPDDLRRLPLTLVRHLDEAITWRPDVAVLSAPPASQPATLERLVRETSCHLFIEKPIATSLRGLADCAQRLEDDGRCSMVGYNLRFHPVVVHVREALRLARLGRVCSARVSVGQYLPDWHPDEDYRSGYSATRALGGGVLLDLIHEIDLLYSWFGPCDAVKAMAGTLSALTINTEDTAEVLYRFKGGILGSVHLDYVQRVPMRQGTIVGEDATLTYDLLENTCRVLRPGESPESHSWPAFTRNDMYVAELATILTAIREGTPCAPSLSEGIDVLDMALRAKADAGLA